MKSDRPNVHTRMMSAQEQGDYQAFISALASRRQALGLSQAALDDLLGVSEGMVAKWETSARLPGAFFLMCWCQALGVRLAVEEQA